MPIEEFDICIKPDPDLIIWRYIDLSKFESLLKDESLFFCRADRFADPFEGSIPKREAEYRITEEKKIATQLGFEFDEKIALRNIYNVSEVHKKFKKQHIVNCWHINNTENDGMWKLYLKDNEGIAIRTTVKKLIKSLSNTKEEINISKVRYLDYEKDIWHHPINFPVIQYNLFVPLIHKRRKFEHENELRLIIDIQNQVNYDEFWSNQENDKGLFIKVDINLLIEFIYTSPTSDNTQQEKIKRLIEKYGYHFQIRNSTLSNPPYY